MRIKSPRDFWAGLVFIAIAAAFIWMATGYRLGTAQRMGPGYFPILVALVMGGLGLVIMARSFVITGPPIEAVGWRQFIVTIIAVAAFGVVLTYAGLAAAIVALVLIGAFADPEAGVGETLVLSLFLAVFSIVVFIYLLGLPLQVWPDWLLTRLGGS